MDVVVGGDARAYPGAAGGPAGAPAPEPGGGQGRPQGSAAAVNAPASPQVFYLVREIAAMLRVSPPTIYRQIACGALPAVRVGHSVRVPADALRAWIAAGGGDPELLADILAEDIVVPDYPPLQEGCS